MPGVKIEKKIGAPPERVFALSTDLPRLADTVSGIDAVEVLTDGPVGVGTRWRETRTLYGRQATEEMWVTHFEAPRSFVVEAESHGAHYRTDFSFEPDGAGTRVTLVFSARPVSLLGRIFSVVGRAMFAGVRKALERDLEDLGRAAEASER